MHWVSHSSAPARYDLLLSFDSYELRDKGDRTVLVACRSDAPVHTQFDRMVFLSRHHARLMGHPDSPAIGGGVRLSDYEHSLKRVPGRIIATSSPDRCRAIFDIGQQYPGFIATYKPVHGLPQTQELTREDLVGLQKTAKALIYPLDPVRPSDFYSMAVLECLAAGTPVIVSDADAMPELWADATVMLKRPIRLAEWVETIDNLLQHKSYWNRMSVAGKKKAKDFDWPVVAQRYLAIAME